VIVQYIGTALSPPTLEMEYRTLARDLFTLTRGASGWLPDTYLSVEPETGHDVFAEMGIRILETPRPLAPKAFSRARDGESLLVLRQQGGIGDILMQTMVWGNLRRQFPSSRLTYALPMQFHPLLEGNPYLDAVVTPAIAGRSRFDHVGDISQICGEVENVTRPCMTHRADIWGQHLGVVMETHELTYTIFPHEAAWAREYVALLRPKPIVAIVPYSADKRKDLPDATTQAIIDGLVVGLGCEVVVLHHQPTQFRRAHAVSDLSLRWLGAFLSVCDLVISVDTGPMHLAAALKRPTIALFGSEDGRVFTTYYPTVSLIQEFVLECQPCWYRTPCLANDGHNSRPGDCLLRLTPERVLTMAEERLKNRSC